MSRYIDADALIERIKRDVITLSPDAAEAKEFMLDHLDMERFVPTVDVVEVVRCKDCKHFVFSKNRAMCGRRATMEYGEWLRLTATDFDHFCSYGERREK